jgi:hypothetical protein
MAIEVPDGVVQFLKNLCAFTGVDWKVMVENEVAKIPEGLLSPWPDDAYYVTVEDLIKRYKLREDC